MKVHFFFKIVLVVVLALPYTSALAQDNAVEVGVPLVGQNAMEYIAQIDQTIFEGTFIGYVTHIDGLPDESLFTPETNEFDRSETDARFTISGTATAVGRSVFQNLTTTAAEASVSIYVTETPATFEDLDSFATGTLIATYTVRFQNIINVQEPNVGVLMMYGDSVQTVAEPFVLDGQTYQLGHPGLVTRFSNFGQGFRSSVEPLAAQYFLVGNMVLLSQ